MNKKIKVKGLICPRCKAFVWSRHRHDFRACPCDYCAADGGRDYVKISYGGPEFKETWESPEVEEREVEWEKACDYEPSFPY